MKALSIFKVLPALPEPLQPLLKIAQNLRWSWDHGAIALFRRLDQGLWEKSGHNPVRMLGSIDQAVLEAAAHDESFLAHQNGVASTLNSYLKDENSWFRREHKADEQLLVAYFSAEFGITECLSIFAGGLGILAGDHLKASSDLGLPLVGVGLLYQQGYFKQYLNAAGWQQEAYQDNDFHTLPIELVPDLRVYVDLPSGRAAAQIWRAQVGRLQLFLLDTNVPENTREQRKITDQLYGGDLSARMQQEILLGIGGYRALQALGFEPTVFHMNEGHSAFLGLERIAHLMQSRQLSFAEARILASSSLIFTTHTPVAAGHDYFPPALVQKYLSPYMNQLGLSQSEFLGLGRKDPGNESEDFCMTVLALRLASFSNGVSALHGVVSRAMWNGIWKGVPEAEVPIGHVTNGVHFRSWVSYEMNQLYDRYLGPKWREEPADAKLWRKSEAIPSLELWRTHERRRERLVAFTRSRLHDQLLRRGSPHSALNEADEVLSPDTLTIGFGRRFASYKRATLLTRDPERLARILNNPQRPVQIIYAGKAHPQDNYGKQLIQTIINLASRPEFRRRLVFLENYDMEVARYMLQGCDVWLNTPLRPMEASGTSGMKAQANGVLNLSILDGWWDEAWREASASGTDVGWAIGNGENYSDPAYQDQVEAEALYEILEQEIVPAFYDRRADGMPARWTARMKSSIAKLCPEFNMHRMVTQYTNQYYVMADRRYRNLSTDHDGKAKNLAAWLTRVQRAWPNIAILTIENGGSEVNMGELLQVAARISLDTLTHEDIRVELLVGRVDADGELLEPSAIAMLPLGKDESGAHVFRAILKLTDQSGMHGYAVRLLPTHPDAITNFWPGLIKWAECSSSVAAESRHEALSTS